MAEITVSLLEFELFPIACSSCCSPSPFVQNSPTGGVIDFVVVFAFQAILTMKKFFEACMTFLTKRDSTFHFRFLYFSLFHNRLILLL